MSVLRADAPFYWPLRGDLALQNGSGSPTFTRATAAWEFNETGKLYRVPSWAVRMRGYRPVINYFSYSEDLVNAVWTKTGISATAAGYVTEDSGLSNHGLQRTVTTPTSINDFVAVKLKVKSDRRYVLLRINDAASNANAASIVFDLQTGSIVTAATAYGSFATAAGSISSIDVNGYYTISLSIKISVSSINVKVHHSAAGALTADGQLNTHVGDGASKLYCKELQFEVTTGADDKTPSSEYVSTNVLSAPYHGAGVDGVKYFSTTKSGAAIPESSLIGAWLNPNSTTNNLLYCRDLTNAAWVKTNVTPTLNQTGIDGKANASSLLTATATDGTVLQTITAAAAAACSGFYVKRSAGTGSIYFTRDGGANWTDITSSINSTDFTLVKIENTSVLNPQIGFKIATSGDAIIVDAGINHLGTQISETPILTTSAAVTVNADVLTAPTTSNFSDTAGTILATVTRDGWTAGNGSAVGSSTRGLYASSANSGAQCLDGTNTVNGPSGTPSGTMRIGIRWSGSSMQAFSNGTFGLAGNYDDSFNLGAAMQLLAGVQGSIKDVAIWPSSLSDSDMIAASKGMTFDGSVASLVLSARDSVMTIGRTIEADAAQINLSAQNGERIIGRTIEAGAASLLLGAQNSLMTIGRTIEADAAALTIIAPDGRVLLDDSPRSAVTIAATLANPIITARL